MRRTTIAAVLAFTGFAAAPRQADAATCTITQALIPIASVSLTGVLPSLRNVALPTEIDEASGRITIDFSGVAPAEFSLSDVSSNLNLSEAGIVTGTIDAGGNVVLPQTQVRFTTAVLPPGSVIGAPTTLTSGIAAVSLQGVDYPSSGSPLDFGTGALRIAGQAALLNAPIVGQVTTGFDLSCTLSPVPSKDALPRANTMTAHGTAKPSADAGDTLSLKAAVKLGETPFDPTQDVLVRVMVGDETVVFLRAPAGVLEGGKKLVGNDDAGDTIHVIAGRKTVNGSAAEISGTLTVVRTKKKLTVKLNHTGTDLTSLTAASSGTTATVTIGMGPLSASDTVTLKPGKKKTTLK